ncbi:G patch domain-containing protein 11-like isoform X2 [Zophobas morio]|uniref:G patch domain-containing protein 11-like isoform X2 n=1 Tax=Zophobas morio TaxID=2755281 RepID=UPI00308305CB
MSESEEEDYLSDFFLLQAEKESTNLKLKSLKNNKTKEVTRIKNSKIDKKKKNIKNVSAIISASPIAADNKGFELMEKMGYKIGEGIGKRREGIKEPIAPFLLFGREGLGLKEYEQKKQEEKIFLERQILEKKEQKNEEIKVLFKNKNLTLIKRRSVQRYLKMSEFACETLDKENGIVDNPLWNKPELEEDIISEEEKEVKENIFTVAGVVIVLPMQKI